MDRKGADTFDRAVRCIREIGSSSPGGIRIGNEELGRIYGLYKQAVEGDCQDSAPWRTSVIKYGKWQAWTALKGMEKEEAMQGYISLTKDIVKRVEQRLWGKESSAFMHSLEETDQEMNPDLEEKECGIVGGSVAESEKLRRLAQLQQRNRKKLEELKNMMIQQNTQASSMGQESCSSLNVVELLGNIDVYLQRLDERIKQMEQRIQEITPKPSKKHVWIQYLKLFSPVCLAFLIWYIRYKRQRSK